MDEGSLEELKYLKNAEDLIKYIEPYYPDLGITEITIENVEKSLMHFFIKLIGKIISFSPTNMRYFLKDFLLKFEIMNIKQIIIGLILRSGSEEISRNINFLVEEYLENTEFIKKLMTIGSLEEIPLHFKGTLYNKAIREGLLYFRNYNEIFVLEAFLDQLYYQNLQNRERSYTKDERKMITLFNSIVTEIYNINIIYRGLLNKIDKKLLAQFLVDNYLFLDPRNLEYLLSLDDINNFFRIIDDLLRRKPELGNFKLLSNSKHPEIYLQRIYYKYYFSKFRQQIEDIEFLTIFKIMEVIIKKEMEIKFEIIPNLVKLLHRKYYSLKKDL